MTAPTKEYAVGRDDHQVTVECERFMGAAFCTIVCSDVEQGAVAFTDANAVRRLGEALIAAAQWMSPRPVQHDLFSLAGAA